MTEEIYTRLMPLPAKIGAFTVRRDDVYTIIINSNLSDEARRREYKHETEHIRNGDFDKRISVDLIEMFAHLT